MKSLHVVNRKGGVGKTTIALHAAWYFAERYRVLFLELDDQRNASSVLQEHAGDLVTSDLLSGPVTVPPLDGPGIRLIAADDEIKKGMRRRGPLPLPHRSRIDPSRSVPYPCVSLQQPLRPTSSL